MGKILAICTSPKRGTVKTEVWVMPTAETGTGRSAC